MVSEELDIVSTNEDNLTISERLNCCCNLNAKLFSLMGKCGHGERYEKDRGIKSARKNKINIMLFLLLNFGMKASSGPKI